MKLVGKDLELLEITHEELTLGNITKQKIKLAAKSAAFNFLQNKKVNHEKVRHVHYESLKLQEYLTSELFSTKEAQMLTALRSHCIRHKFSKIFRYYLKCPLNCSELTPHEDTQEHVLYCKTLNQSHEETPTIQYMYGNLYKQQKLSQKFCTLMGTRTHLLEPQEEEEETQKI